MAERRMFAKTIIDSDAFLEMPQSTQLLYFHLSMRADDDGFVNKPKTIMRISGCRDDDMKLLIVKKFIISFDSGVVVIKHWRIHNYIQSDRYHETKYIDEKSQLAIDSNRSYTEIKDGCIQDVSIMDTQVRLDKVSLDKISQDKKRNSEKTAYAEFVTMTLTEYEELCTRLGIDTAKQWIESLNLWKGSKGRKTKSDYMTILAWSRRREEEKQTASFGKLPERKTIYD